MLTVPANRTACPLRLAGAAPTVALENCVSQIADGAGRFPQVAGMRFALAANAPYQPRSDRRIRVAE